MVGIRRPSGFFFDEQAYVSSARALLTGAPNPNPEHPPLGKYLIAAGISLAGDNPLGWRLSGAVCGALTLIATFLWTNLLLHDYRPALTAAALTLLNNFLFVMSRVAMLDVFSVMFVMWALVSFTAAVELELDAGVRRVFLLFSGLLFGLAAACKWNAVVSLAVVFAISLALLALPDSRLSEDRGLARYARSLRAAGAATLLLSLLVVPIVSYLLAYAPLFRVSHMPFTAREIIRTHVMMWKFLRGVEGNPAIHSPWYEWPFHTSPQRALSYLLGNFVVMWVGLVALAVCLRRWWRSVELPELLVVLLYAANWLPWAVAPRKVTYYYYYFPAAMFLGVAVAVALSRIRRSHLFGVRLSLIILAAAALVFLYCYPNMAHLEAPWDCMFGCWS